MHLSLPILKLLAWVYGYMLCWTAACVLHPKLRRPEARALRQAGLGWWPSTLVCGAALLGGPWVTVPVFAVVSAWTLREFLRLLPADQRHPTVDAVAYAAVPLHYAALLSERAELFFGVVLLWIFGVLPFTWVRARGPKGLLSSVPKVQFGVVLTVVAISYVPRLMLLGPRVGPAGSTGLVALLFLCVMANDALQYLTGKLFGRHPLAPVVSPKKTWEGFGGGASLTAALAALAAPMLTPFSPAMGALLALGLCTLGLLGDLLVSAIKRDAGVKDMGAVLPGQGGLLDRCDSLLLTAPLFTYWAMTWLR